MMLPMFQSSANGNPILKETYISPNGHLGMFNTEIVEDCGQYYKVLEQKSERNHGCVQEHNLPQIESLLSFFNIEF